MRIFRSILRSAAIFGVCAGLTGADAVRTALKTNKTDCSSRKIRLWIHLDLTGSFTNWREASPPELKKSMTYLAQKYPNLEFGVSGFGDRPRSSRRPIGQMDNQCYVPGADFSDAFGDDKFDKITQMTKLVKDSFADLEEDPLSAMPWIAKNKFGDFTSDELRIFAMVTDYGPHYGPIYTSGTAEPDYPAEDFVTCDCNKRYATLNELFDPVKERRIIPIVTVYPLRDCMENWTTALKEVGYNVTEHLVDMGSNYVLTKFTETIEKLVDENQCEPAPTNAPSDGTVPTLPPPWTEAPPAHPTEEPSVHSTEEPPAASTQPNAPDDPTSAIPFTVEPSDRASPKMTPILVGASAGAAALIAAGLVYRFLQSSAPTLDLEGGVNARDSAVGAAEREAVAINGEEAYN